MCFLSRNPTTRGITFKLDSIKLFTKLNLHCVESGCTKVGKIEREGDGK